MTDVRIHAMPDGRHIAFRSAPGIAPAIVFLPGYKSDMSGGKATAVFDWARREGRACLLLDYSGCGASDGEFAEGTLSRWRDEVVALVEAEIAGPVVLVGSSLGGWLMLLVAAALGERTSALVGIAAAPDFTDWGVTAAERAGLERGETVLQANPYGPDPTPIYAEFWHDAQAQRMLGGEIALDCPVRLLHGQRDADVPFEVSLRLAERLRSEDVQAILIKDGDHRLSRDSDVALLIRTIAALSDVVPGP